MKHIFISFLILAFTFTAYAGESKWVRWTLFEDRQSDMAHILSVINAKTGFNLSKADFLQVEKTPLANSNFLMLAQTSAGIPINGRQLRIWTDLKTGDAIQIEAMVEAPIRNLVPPARIMSSQDTTKLITDTVMLTQDSMIKSLKWNDMWENNDLLRFVNVKARRGVHKIKISLKQNKVTSQSYEEYPQADQSAKEISIPAQVYRFYEQAETVQEIQPRVRAELKYVKNYIPRTSGNPYQLLQNKRYLSPYYNPILAETAQGQAQGYWSMDIVKRAAAKVLATLPLVENNFTSGLMLDGKYATISLHPDVKQLTGLNFTPLPSAHLRFDWQVVTFQGQQVYEMFPKAGLQGKPLFSADEALNRAARRLADHNPVEYINDGFDELQVYYAINTLMESLQNNGMVDPELSTRPFNAFLFDPDIEMRDNAYYTEDTINFTTYSADQPNYARDNLTIWHELGHGVMDRLMGSNLELADTGGLSEGMADFVAALVTADLTNGAEFPGSQDLRIINNTGFLLTNEVHDDGEAYGGAMKDMLDAAMSQYGREGVRKMTDLTLEAMRLSRNHPALTANEWYNRMLFADQMGSLKVRNPGELKPLILKALAGRNFSLVNAPAASAPLFIGQNEVTGYSLGSRRQPIKLSLVATEKISYNLSLKPQGTDTYKFQYPLTVKVFFRSGPLQGAVRWDGEEAEPLVMTINTPQEAANFTLTASGTCDQVNLGDGSCKDYAYVQLFNNGNDKKPVAKKRFYLQIKSK
ncbi:MAG: hypothetical protein SGI74_00520 [Oligoflexia bacterium]|nr:hypothetical protein [Oligoflexia bacterium]